LKAGSAFELNGNREIQRRHGFQDVQPAGSEASRFPRYGFSRCPPRSCPAVVIGGRFLEDGAAGVQFMQDLFEPELVGLMDDDEEILLVGM